MEIKKNNVIIKLYNGDITDLDTDAIVNAANKELRGGSGVCGAIFNKAGRIELQKECYEKGPIHTGEAAITSGYSLKAKYIIHAVGPIYSNNDEKESKLLSSAYLSSLKLAEEYNLKSIAFPSISTGVYGYPILKASKIAFDTIINYEYKTLEKVVFVCYDTLTFEIYKRLFDEYNSK